MQSDGAGAPGVRVKICGITSPADARMAAEAGTDYLGMIFVPRSPRAISVDAGRAIAAAVPTGVQRVALTVDADDALISAIGDIGVDWIQMHGSEPPERVAEVRAKTGLRVMKAVGIRDAADLDQIDLYAQVADQILVDAKPPNDAPVPGGHGVAFDWQLIAGRTWQIPWMLAGGLAPDNVATAISLTHARQVDVASGTEAAPGIKDPRLVRAFVAAAKAV